MPRYEYWCALCEKKYEIRHSYKEKHNVCEKCGNSGGISKMLSTPFKMRFKPLLDKKTLPPGLVVNQTIADTKGEITKDKAKLKKRIKK